MKSFRLISMISSMMFLVFMVSCGTTAGNSSTDNNVINDTPVTGDTDTVGADIPVNADQDGAVQNDQSAGNDDDQPAGTGSVIEKIQKGEIAVDSVVEFEAVVTGVVYLLDASFNPTGIKGIFVSDPITKALPYTGIYVFVKSAAVDAYARGDLLSVKGTYKEYYDQSQVESPEISKLSDATEPEPALINDPSKVATPFEANPNDTTGKDPYLPTTNHGADGEKYESVLIEIKDVEVTNENLGHGAWEVTGGLAVDKFIYYYDGNRQLGTKFKSIKGILIYSYDAFRLAPRDANDLVPETVEQNDTDQGNDGTVNPDTTGSDTAVQPDADTSSNISTTVDKIQKGEITTDKTPAKLDKVMVISPMHKHSGTPTTYSFFVGKEGGGDYSGLYVYKMSQTEFQMGDWLTITGVVGVYTTGGEHYQMQNGAQGVVTNEVKKLSDPKGTPAPAVTITSYDAKYRGSLVKVENVKVKTAADQYGNIILEGDITVSSYFVPADTMKNDAVGTEFTSITGIYDFSYGLKTLFPVSADGLVRKTK